MMNITSLIILNNILMKLFSFKPAVSFENGNIVLNDLAKNHPYQKKGCWLIVEGFDESSQVHYEAFYSLKGEFRFIHLRKSKHTFALVPWKQQYDVYMFQKIDWLGNSYTRTDKYSTTNEHSSRMVERTFTSTVNNQKVEKKFTFTNGKISSEGNFPKAHFHYWIN